MAKRPTYKELEQRVRELEKEAAQRKGVEERAYLENTLASTPDGVLLLDEQGRFRYVNPSFLKWLGREAKDFVGRTVQEVSPPFMSPEITKLIAERAEKRLKTGEPIVGAEVEIIGRAGKPMLVSYSAAGIRDRKGDIMGEVVFIRDTTERKRAEKALRESEEKYRLLAESLLDAVYEFDLEGKFNYANEAATQMFGYSKDEILSGLRAEDTTVKEDKATSRKAIGGILKGKTAVGERTFIRKDGTTFIGEIHSGPIYKGKDVVGVRGVLRDITERKEAEQALREREAELEIKTQSLEEVNAALRVLLKRRDDDKTELEEKVLVNVKELAVPFLERLRNSPLDPKQVAYLHILESNLKDIISPFLRTLSAKYTSLTPTEIQVANLIREGKRTKEIAELLHLSTKTINTHRRNIRMKLGMTNRKVNLRSHLLSLQ